MLFPGLILLNSFQRFDQIVSTFGIYLFIILKNFRPNFVLKTTHLTPSPKRLSTKTTYVCSTWHSTRFLCRAGKWHPPDIHGLLLFICIVFNFAPSLSTMVHIWWWSTGVAKNLENHVHTLHEFLMPRKDSIATVNVWKWVEDVHLALFELSVAFSSHLCLFSYSFLHFCNFFFFFLSLVWVALYVSHVTVTSQAYLSNTDSTFYWSRAPLLRQS